MDDNTKAADAVDGRAAGRAVLLRRIRRAVIAVAAVLVLAVLPAFLSGRPGFFGRYPGLQDKYEPWAKSTHVSASCSDCHTPPDLVSTTVHAARMVGEFYVSLVSRSRVPDVFPTPVSEACEECHYDLRSVSPKGDLLIPHRAHVTILKMECVECHDYIVHEPSPEGKRTPMMAGCLECHDGDTAKDACTACHTEKGAPDTHKAQDWVVVHAQRGDDPECETCHAWTPDWCVDCHGRRPRSHGDDWRAVHRDQVAVHRNCEACHDGVFCEECHGEVPALNLDPNLEIVR